MNEKKEEENKGFELTHQEEQQIIINTLDKAASYLETIGNFASWSAKNIESINIIKESYYIMEDFVKSNEHIIQKISKISKT